MENSCGDILDRIQEENLKVSQPGEIHKENPGRINEVIPDRIPKENPGRTLEGTLMESLE